MGPLCATSQRGLQGQCAVDAAAREAAMPPPSLLALLLSGLLGSAVGTALDDVLPQRATAAPTQRDRLSGLLSAAGAGRRLQLGNLLNAAANAGGPGGATSDVDPPAIKGSGTFVLDRERHLPKGDGPGNITAELAPGAGIFVNYVNLSFGVSFNGTRRDGTGKWPNTTAAETHYVVQYCENALFSPDTANCPEKFDVLGNFRAVFYGDENAGNEMDRFNSDGIAEWNGKWGQAGDAGPVIVSHVGWIFVEAFTLLVETNVQPSPVTGLYPLPTIVAMSAVSYANFTVVPDPVMPILDPPQDFFDGTLNVTLETPTNASHVFFTLQPPFVNDKNGTWCPHMGVWCSNYPHEPEYHAVPNQPPNFWYSQRGMFSRMFEVPYYSRWNTMVPSDFPQTNLTILSQYYLDLCEQYGDCALKDAAEKLQWRLENGYGLINGSRPTYSYDDTIQDRLAQTGPDGLVDGFVAQNISLYPQYTFEKPPGVWLQFQPVQTKALEMFHVDVFTCFNVSWAKPELHYRTRTEYRSTTNALGVVQVQEYTVREAYNIMVNTTEADCTHVMQAPARNPCPWSRDCKLLGEVSFKLRAFAMKEDYVNSATASGLYTFITGGTPRWMNTRDECGGVRQSSVHPHLTYAVSDHTIWEILAPYDCPPGYHWASTDEVLDLLDFEGMEGNRMWEHNISAHTWLQRQRTVEESDETSTELTYASQCGWDELFWEGKVRRYFRFSDSGPRYLQFEPESGAQWPEEGYFFRGDYPTTTQSHPSQQPHYGHHEGMDIYHSHLTAWYWYQHNENFTLNWIVEQAGLYSTPTNATWATKTADSLDYTGLEIWTGDNLGFQPQFAGAVCRTNGDWTPPRVVILGPLILTLEVHDPYIEFGAYAWDPVDDIWYREWKTRTCDGIDDDIDDCVVRISGHVDYDTVGVYHMYYDATDLHGNDARQQMRTVIIVDRTVPILTVTQGVHQRVCEPWTQQDCHRADMNYAFRVPLSDDGYEMVTSSDENLRCKTEAWRRDDVAHDDPAQCAALARADPKCGDFFAYWRGGQCACVEVGDDCSELKREYSGLITDTAIYRLLDLNYVTRSVDNQDLQGLACPPQHTCDRKPNGFLANRGERTRGTHITIEAGTPYVELGATATDNEKDNHALTSTIVTRYYGPIKHFETVERPYPVYPYWYMVNMALKEKLEEEARNIASGLGLPMSGGVGSTTTTMVINEVFRGIKGGRIGDGEALGRQQLEDCGFEGYPDECDFEWSATAVGFKEDQVQYPAADPFYFNTSIAKVIFPEGYEMPTTLTPNSRRQIAAGVHAVLNTQEQDQPDTIHFDYVNYMLPGVYNVTYDVVDDYNNTAVTVSRTVTVKDTTPPVLHLIGDPIMIVRYNETFVDPGAYATDIGDDYYYSLNRMDETQVDGRQTGRLWETENLTFSDRYCNGTACTYENENRTISDKIVTRIHHERLECEVVPIFARRNETQPICEYVPGGERVTLSCPNISGHVMHISGFNFISFGRPTGECGDPKQPLTKSPNCGYFPDEDAGLPAAIDEEVFNQLCLGETECELLAEWSYWGMDAYDPCPGAEKWLIVEATCDYTYDGDVIGERVDCSDSEIQIPKLGLRGQPPVLGYVNWSLPGLRAGQYPMSRFNGEYAGTWDQMDDFLSRLDPELGELDEKCQHQDIWGEYEFLRERTDIENEVYVNTTINTTVLGLYIITYDVTDMAANEATQIVRFVIVQDDSELYQNSIQQNHDGTPGTFTGGILPHETGASIRVASREADLSRNRPTKACTVWGDHTPSSAAVDGDYTNDYVMPIHTMDEYGRTLAEDHIPNIFMSGPPIWNDLEPPRHHQWWMVHLASNTDDPRVIVYTRGGVDCDECRRRVEEEGSTEICCTAQFGGVLELYIGDSDTPPYWAGEQRCGTEGGSGGGSQDARGNTGDGDSDGDADLLGLPTFCGLMENLEDGGVFEAVCEGTGEYLFIAATSYFHLAEVDVFGYGGGPGQGHNPHDDAPADMANGRRHDVGLHHDGAQYAITVPVENVTTTWWVGVPFVTGRQLIVELNTTWPDENRSITAYVHHATYGGDINGTEYWNMTETGEKRRASDGFIYEGETAHTVFDVMETLDLYIEGNVLHKLKYAMLPSLDSDDPQGSASDMSCFSHFGDGRCCACDPDLVDPPDPEETPMPCEVQCPSDPNDPYLYDFKVSTSLQFIADPRQGVTGGEDFFVTSIEAQMPVEYWSSFASWGKEWVANTLGLDCQPGNGDAFPCYVTKLQGNAEEGYEYVEDFVSYNFYHWRDINLVEEPPSSLKLETWHEDPRKRGVARTVIGCNPERFEFNPKVPYWQRTPEERAWADMTDEERHAAELAEMEAEASGNRAGDGGRRRRTQQDVAWQSEEPEDFHRSHVVSSSPRSGTFSTTAHDGVLEASPSARYFSRERGHDSKNGYTERGYEYMSSSERNRYQNPDSPWTERYDHYDSEPGASARNVGLTEGRYFITVKAEPIVRMDSILRNDFVSGRNTKKDGVYTLKTDPIREVEFQAVPYSIRTTFVEPILLPSAVDVNATVSDDIKTIYYFEIYLNQKVALELAGSDSANEGTAAILSYQECTERTDDWGYLGKGRLQTYTVQPNRPPGYDYLSLCPHELNVGRYYVEMRSHTNSNYTLRLTEYTPYCPNDCSNSTGQGFCDCTILRCICRPGYFGDDCSFEAAKIEIDSFPFQTGLHPDKWPTGWETDLDSVPFPTGFPTSVTLDHHGGGQQGDSVSNNWPNQSTPGFDHRGTRFNQTCPPGYVLIGLNGSYYDYQNPHLFERTSQRLVRRVDLICGLLLGPTPDQPSQKATIGTRSNETVLVSNGHALSIYARTLSRYSYRQEYLSPEQLDLDCVTPGGKSHLDECRLLHGIWSEQQTMYMRDEPTWSWSCGDNELFVGQTVDVLTVNQTCERDGFGCQPHFRICNYTMVNETSLEVFNLTIPCHELCQVQVLRNGNFTHRNENTTESTEWVLCNGTDHTSPWALENYDRYWPGNDYDWRSMKYFGKFTNDYYATFRADSLHAEGEPINLLRDFIEGGVEYHEPFSYEAPERLHANDGAYGNEYWAWQGDQQGGALGRRRAQAWGHARRLQLLLAGLPSMEPDTVEVNITNVTVIDVNVNEYEYITEVGGICEKISFAENLTAPGAAVLVRYEDDAHYPVDKVVGAGAQDNAPNMRGCSGKDCPVGDQYDAVHHKQRCPPGTVVTGMVTHSGDWLDSIEYVCSPIHLISAEVIRQRGIDDAQREAEEAAALLAQLAQLAGGRGGGGLGLLGRR